MTWNNSLLATAPLFSMFSAVGVELNGSELKTGALMELQVCLRRALL